ncbi:MAG TPA: VCBS repeat-containing protein, partial [Humisphaera sp.]
FGEKDEPAVIAVRAKGVFREAPVNEKADAKADPKAKPPADDLHRLTGYEPKALFPAVATDAGIAAAAVAAIDVNGDGRKDLVVLSGDGAVILIARGYGAFFVIARKADELFKGAAAPGAGTVLAAADVDGDKREDLIAVTADGKVLVVTK